jgi:hypothetical protein
MMVKEFIIEYSWRQCQSLTAVILIINTAACADINIRCIQHDSNIGETERSHALLPTFNDSS